jgi:hypothetical protein
MNLYSQLVHVGGMELFAASALWVENILFPGQQLKRVCF